MNNNTYGPTGLPVVTSEITIVGTFNTGFYPNNPFISSPIIRDSSAPDFRILAVCATGNLTLNVTTVSGGVTDVSGAGVYNNGTLMLMDSNVTGNNSAYAGGGIFNGGTLTGTLGHIYGNTASAFGGGVYSTGTMTLTDSRVDGNTVTNGGGGGIFNNGTMTPHE